MEIPLIRIPEDSTCQEASRYSVTGYIPCGNIATAIVYHNRDRRGYYMCTSCASHNLHNRGGKLVTASTTELYMDLLTQE